MTYDAIVIGGGITGAGVARDFALRGWKALLLERGRFGRATTAGSSHLIHGGLRYLLYDRLTTHETCWDSGHIVRIARPLLTRLPILWPVYGDHRRGLETVETLLESYDRFQPLKGGRPHLRLNPAETLRLVPGLKPVDLRGGLLFDEYWVEAADLVAANVADARRAGADAFEDTGVEAITRENGRVTGVRVIGGKIIQAPVLVNAAGPWAARVAALAGAAVDLRLQKGTHLVYRGSVPALAGLAPWAFCSKPPTGNGMCSSCPGRTGPSSVPRIWRGATTPTRSRRPPRKARICSTPAGAISRFFPTGGTPSPWRRGRLWGNADRKNGCPAGSK
ncbi:MAG: FAD-dependent oxidoreductase [Elusimicrobia bacterium]|nr:FAD-dependent oxidoreductase [Elusimicrobiota bacterium]